MSYWRGGKAYGEWVGNLGKNGRFKKRNSRKPTVRVMAHARSSSTCVPKLRECPEHGNKAIFHSAKFEKGVWYKGRVSPYGFASNRGYELCVGLENVMGWNNVIKGEWHCRWKKSDRTECGWTSK